jgi:hypothetical protein
MEHMTDAVRAPMLRAGFTFACVLAVVAIARPAGAQGNGRGHAYGHYKSTSGSGPSAAGAPQLETIPGTGVRNFGSWLDDASVLPVGRGLLSISFGYWRTPAFREFDVPVVDGGVALTRRVQLGFSVPYYHASEPGGPVARGVGDLFLSSKIQLRDPSSAQRRVGFALVPVLEVRSNASAPGDGRVSWALPGSAEIQSGGWRVFGSAGYFSRGALFASGALELALSNRAWVTGTISESHSIARDDLSVALGLSQTRTDVSGGLAVALSPIVVAFGNVGRTISKQDPNSATLLLTSGVSFNFDTWRVRRP